VDRAEDRVDTLTGDVVDRRNPAYEAARMDFNRRIQRFPLYVVFCASGHDVRDAVLWSRAHGVPLRVRSGRHSYEDYSVLDHGVVIDVSALNAVELDAARRTAHIGAGANLGQIYDALWDQGRVTIPGGGCTGVGIAGLALGGGFGFLARPFGLTCDSMEALEMVDARGRVVVADARQNEDLFWGSRGGGGGNFGAVTRFTFRVQPIDNVTVFSIVWPWDAIRPVFAAWQAWADPDTLDPRLTPILILPAKSAGYINAIGEFVGPFAELDRLIQPLLRAAPPSDLQIVYEPYIDAVHRFVGSASGGAAPQGGGGLAADAPQSGGGSAPDAPQSGAVRLTSPAVRLTSRAVRLTSPGGSAPDAPQGGAVRLTSRAVRLTSPLHRWAADRPADPALDKFKNTSAFQFHPFDGRAVDVMLAELERSPSPNTEVQFNLHGGAEARVPPHATAYPWRGARYSLQYQAYWSDPAEGPALIRWVEGFRRALLPWTRGAYVNYIDGDIADWPTAYYDANVARLVAVKRRYDPDNVFDFPQGIGRIRLP